MWLWCAATQTWGEAGVGVRVVVCNKDSSSTRSNLTRSLTCIHFSNEDYHFIHAGVLLTDYCACDDACAWLHIYIYIYMYGYVYMYLNMYVCISVCLSSVRQPSIFVCNIYIYMYVGVFKKKKNIYIYIYLCIYIYIYSHVCLHIRLSVVRPSVRPHPAGRLAICTHTEILY